MALFKVDTAKQSKLSFWLILGIVCFAAPMGLLLIHLGFITEGVSAAVEQKPFLSELELVLISVGLGLLGGWCLDRRHALASIPAGGIGAFVAIYVGLLYFGGRESVLQLEVLVPLLVGLVPGGIAYNVLMRLLGYPRKAVEPENAADPGKRTLEE